MSSETGPAWAGAEVPDGEHRRLVAKVRAHVPARLPADDQVDELLWRRVGDVAHADRASVAEHDDAVGDLEHLVEAVGDVDHADAALAKLAQHREQVADVLRGQARRRFVEHEEVALDGERPGDRDHRLLRPGQAPDAHRRREVATDPGECLPRRPLAGAPVDERAAARVATGHRDVLADAHPLDQAEVLVDERDRLAHAGVAGRVPVGHAVDDDVARVRRVDAAEDLDQRRLPGAVLPEERDDLAAPDVHRHVGQRPRAAERFRHVVEEQPVGQCRGRSRRPVDPSVGHPIRVGASGDVRPVGGGCDHGGEYPVEGWRTGGTGTGDRRSTRYADRYVARCAADRTDGQVVTGNVTTH